MTPRARTAQQPEPERRRPNRKRFALQLALFANELVIVTAVRPVVKQLLLPTVLVSAACGLSRSTVAK